MKKSNVSLLCLSFAAFALARQVQAEPSFWASLNTTACVVTDGKGAPAGDTNPSTANVPMYTAYYCDIDTAQKKFGASDVAGLERYFASSFSAGKSILESVGTGMNAWGYYEAGQYSFMSEDLDKAVAVGSYLAVAFYGDEAFRVFANDMENTESGHVVFDDAVGGTAGMWNSVPEPTSGLLLLLGLAGLSLRRRFLHPKYGS